MKKITSLLFLIALVAFTFTSCKKDDPKPTYPSNWAGEFSGYFTGTISLNWEAEQNYDFEIARVSDKSFIFKGSSTSPSLSFDITNQVISNGSVLKYDIIMPDQTVGGVVCRGAKLVVDGTAVDGAYFPATRKISLYFWLDDDYVTIKGHN